MSQQLKQKKHILQARYKNGICYITGIELDKKNYYFSDVTKVFNRLSKR